MRTTRTSIHAVAPTQTVSEFAIGLALENAFEPGAHTHRDIDAVRNALACLPLGPIPDSELIEFARAWLDAAMFLRVAGLPATFAALVGVVAAGNTAFASLHARELFTLVQRSGDPESYE